MKDSGVGFFGLLTVLFVGLKLGHVIDWPWWLVFGPLWIPIVVVLVAFAAAVAALAFLRVVGPVIFKTR